MTVLTLPGWNGQNRQVKLKPGTRDKQGKMTLKPISAKRFAALVEIIDAAGKIAAAMLAFLTIWLQ